jgi:hypothetical protein
MSTETAATAPTAPAPTAMADKIYTCGYNCRCTKQDCNQKHYISSFEERKFAANIWGMIPDISDHIKETNVETRKVNCHKGQLCQKADCGYRHFLDPEGRQKFIAAMNIADFAKSKKKPLSDDEKTLQISKMQEQIKMLEEKMETVMAALAAVTSK